jgi:hypothetical protein
MMDGIKDASIIASEVNMSSTVVDIPSLVSKLTLEEKISLLAGVDWWRTFSVDRDGVLVPQIKVIQ